MTEGAISFSCPACNVRLTVPESMAGIRGACPRCTAIIQAPGKAGIAPRVPVSGDMPRPTPHASIRKSPRVRPEGRPAIEARRSTDDQSLQVKPVARRGRATIRSNRLHLLIPMLFGLAGGVLVYFILYEFSAAGPARKLLLANLPPTPAPPQPQPQQPPSPSPAEDESMESSASAVDPASVYRRQPMPVIEGAEGAKAQATLERFLAAPTLKQRALFFEPKPILTELEAVLRDEPFPEVISILATRPFRHELEGWNGHPFRVTFRGGEGSTASYLVLVVCEPDQLPKIASGPFLDLYGGRLARFCASPTDELGTFQAIVEPMSWCFEEEVPDADRKFTFKLSASLDGAEIARAYTNRNSHLAEALASPGPGLHFGARIRASFTLGWNRSEDPDRPFLEMIEINETEWAP